MKKQYIILTLAVVTLFTACDKFLSESSQDEVRPSTASDYQQILLGEAYPLSDCPLGFLDMLTDDVKNNYTEATNQQTALQNGVALFSWQRDMFEKMKDRGLSVISNPYERYYQYIMGCNVVLDNIDKCDGSEEDKGNVKGQALALRGYYYFILANLFAQPYNAEIDRTAEPCVPLILQSTVKDEFPKRNTVSEVYAQIEKDLREAEPLMEKYGTGNVKDKVTDQFVHHMLCRLFLYEERWDECIAEANKVLEKQPGLLKIANYSTSDNLGFYTMHVYHPDSPELIWCYASDSESSDFLGSVNGGDVPAYLISDDLVSLYDYNDNSKNNKGDMRARFFYTWYALGELKWDPVTGVMTQAQAMRWGRHNYNSGDASRGFRTAEDYLNRAECYARLYKSKGNESFRTQALADLNTLRESRWQGTYTVINISDADELLDFCLEERRRELSFDDNRWFDLRRLGMPSISHTLTLTKGQPVVYSLHEKDKKYVLPIPQESIDRNTSLIQNPE